MTTRKSKSVTAVIASDSSKSKRLNDTDTGSHRRKVVGHCSSHESRFLTIYSGSPLEKCSTSEETDSAVECRFLEQ